MEIKCGFHATSQRDIFTTKWVWSWIFWILNKSSKSSFGHWPSTFLEPRNYLIEDRVKRFVVEAAVMGSHFVQDRMAWLVVESLSHQWALGSSVTVL